MTIWKDNMKEIDHSASTGWSYYLTKQIFSNQSAGVRLVDFTVPFTVPFLYQMTFLDET